MNFLTLENVSKTYGEKTLFQNLSLQVNQGQKIALVAKNGTGKTTLLKVIAGIEPSDGETNKVLIKKSLRLSYLQQEPEFFGEHSVLESVLDSEHEVIKTIRRYEELMLHSPDDPEMPGILAKMDDLKAWETEARIKEILTKFGITQLDQSIKTLSGGQRKRLALAKLIIEEPEFLILDEPTNHLDLDMIEWLENYLQQSKLTLFMVTHDRYFLERICNQIVELDQGILYRYSGNYSAFLEKKANRHENENTELDKSRKLLKRELEWIRRQPKARGTKAKSRVDSFYDLEEKVSGKKEQTEIRIDIKGQRQGKKILEAHNIGKSFGDFKIVEGFSYKFKKKERVGIAGPNGIGKTTFLKLLTKQIRPDSGKIVVGDTTAFGYYTQEGIQLNEDKRVIDVIRDIAEYIPLEKGQKLSAPQLLERFLFNRKQQQIFVSQLSGGERRRLFLLSVLMKNPNFLILDEPTNDLDIISLNVLEEFLMDFPGCIIIVTHDRYFMDKIAEHLFIFEGEGKIKDFNGDYSDYRNLQKEREREQRRLERLEQQKTKQADKPAEDDRPKLTYEQRKELGRLEKEIGKLEARKAEITEQFNNTAITTGQIEELAGELGEINKTLEEKEMQWLELAELA